MSFVASSSNIQKALNNTHPRSDDGWVNTLADRATGNPFIRFGCVTAVKALANTPPTIAWRRGKKVKGTSSILPGTAIATFGKLGNGMFLFKGHAAIFDKIVGGDLYVYDQWWGNIPSRRKQFNLRPISFNCGGYVSNDAEAFYTIELTEDLSGDPLFCGPDSFAE